MPMHHGPTRLLEDRAIFRSRDLDETRAFLRSKNFVFDAPGAADAPLDVRINGVYMPNVYIGYIEYGAAAVVSSTPARSDHWLQWPVRGRVEATLGREAVACTAQQAAVISPTAIHTTRSEAGSARINLAFAAGVLTRHLAALTGDIVAQPLAFAPAMDLSQGHGRTLASSLRLAIAEFERPHGVFWQPLMMSQFEQFLMTQLLLGHPHNHSDALERRCRPISPRDVKRAIDYIHANLDQPIAITDLVAVSGVAGRTLFKHFRDFRGMSPMGYVRRARLEQARGDLLRAAPDERVTAIASRWGFDHMGRFSLEYRRAFGESPSQTMGKGRRRQLS